MQRDWTAELLLAEQAGQSLLSSAAWSVEILFLSMWIPPKNQTTRQAGQKARNFAIFSCLVRKSKQKRNQTTRQTQTLFVWFSLCLSGGWIFTRQGENHAISALFRLFAWLACLSCGFYF